NLTTSYSHRYAKTPAWSIAPKLDFQGETVEVAVRPFYSTSKFEFIDNDEGFFQRTDSRLNNIGFTATRSSLTSPNYYLTQTEGPDWGEPTNWVDATNYNIYNNENFRENEQYGTYIDLKKHLTFNDIPVTLLGGAGTSNIEFTDNTGNQQQYRYVGPTGNQAEAVVEWHRKYQYQFIGIDGGNINEQGWRSDSNYGMYDLFAAHPEYFEADTVGNLERMLRSHTQVEERVDAAYVEVQASAGKARHDLGLRCEETSTDALVITPRTTSEMVASGHPLNASGIPTPA